MQKLVNNQPVEMTPEELAQMAQFDKQTEGV